MLTSIRLDEKSSGLVARLARKRATSRSQVIRDAITAYGKQQEQAAATIAEALAPFVGCVRSGRGDLSQNTGEGFAALLQEKARRRQRGET